MRKKILLGKIKLNGIVLLESFKSSIKFCVTLRDFVFTPIAFVTFVIFGPMGEEMKTLSNQKLEKNVLLRLLGILGQ